MGICMFILLLLDSPLPCAHSNCKYPCVIAISFTLCLCLFSFSLSYSHHLHHCFSIEFDYPKGDSSIESSRPEVEDVGQWQIGYPSNVQQRRGTNRAYSTVNDEGNGNSNIN